MSSLLLDLASQRSNDDGEWNGHRNGVGRTDREDKEREGEEEDGIDEEDDGIEGAIGSGGTYSSSSTWSSSLASSSSSSSESVPREAYGLDRTRLGLRATGGGRSGRSSMEGMQRRDEVEVAVVRPETLLL